jgi:hypothetical protein
MKRLVEADILRTEAIALIVLAHLPDYLSLPGLQPYTVHATILGNGLFVFLSGYLTHAAARRHPRSTLASLMGTCYENASHGFRAHIYSNTMALIHLAMSRRTTVRSIVSVGLGVVVVLIR